MQHPVQYRVIRLMMQKRDIVLTAVFSSLAALILLAGIGAACYFFHKRRRKRDDDDDEDSPDANCSRIEAGHEKKSRLNGFLSLKTPLISTKTLGEFFTVARTGVQKIFRYSPHVTL
ncbi:hypothetical protein TcasGA2_TC014959 [Tribolium castaneum]|uniref:Uncharacterized protein n=1 Tax=Tribolium castaneum TaxID=7070 RepID=D2A3Q8_TRICA|nr:hypothetical protein TcasGA2_TC014959 [Tribolium castaneum]